MENKRKVIKLRAVPAKKNEPEIIINTPFIKLDSALKLCGEANTGGHAKIMIAEGDVFVDGVPCFQRGRKLKDGDSFRVGINVYKIVYRPN